MNAKFDNYQYQIDLLNGHRDKYCKEIITGDHLMVQNRVREYYLGAVDSKIEALKRERSAMDRSKSGIESVMLHMYFNGQQPFLSDHDGSPVTNAVRHELYPRYEEILKLNVDILNEFKVETTQYPQYIRYNDDGVSDRYEHQRWSLFPISLTDIETIDYDDLKAITLRSMECITRNNTLDAIFLVMPELSCNSSDPLKLAWEWMFGIRCVTKKAR